MAKKTRALLDFGGVLIDKKVFEKFTKKISIVDMRTVGEELVIKYTAKGIQSGEVRFKNLL